MSDIPQMGAVFWPVGTGDSTTLVITDEIVMQIDLHDMAKADEEDAPEVPIVDELVQTLPTTRDGDPYLAVFALTHADKDHCLGFADLLDKAVIGELWATPRLWREYEETDGDDLCSDAQAFQEEAKRRVAATMAAVAEDRVPASGDRILVIGYDTEHSKHAYDELPDAYKAWPGRSITRLDQHECAGQFEAFVHAPFKNDCAAARNDTSLALHVTLTDDSGESGRLLLFGDLAHDTIIKIFTVSEAREHEQYLAWDLLLAPHHCSKKVMYVPDETGTDQLQTDVIAAFTRHAVEGAVVVASSGVIPAADKPNANPPHRKAANRYAEIADEFINTMSWPDATSPVPVVFVVDDQGAAIVRDDTVMLAARQASTKSAPVRFGRRLAAVTAAATTIASAVGATGLEDAERGPQRLRRAIDTDRGGAKAPPPVGFGR